MADKKSLFKIRGKVQHYQWGGGEYLPSLLNMKNQPSKPFAEYWLGTHPLGIAAITELPDSDLDAYIQNEPSTLGEDVRFRFGGIPYLLKILDVKDMLSIQVHPNKKSAVESFADENSKGVALDSAFRNYKDDNHKPELMYALSDFWLLHGFKEPGVLKNTLTSIKELAFLDAVFDRSGYTGIYQLVMEMEQRLVNLHLKSLLDQIIPQYQMHELSKSSPHFWAARAALSFNQGDNIDRGIFSIYLLNLVHLEEGEAIFQDAGILHAYLEGQNVEIMANSDNVLRGGLTLKHIDVPELLKHVSFKAHKPHVIHGTKRSENEVVFETPALDFELSRLRIAAGQRTAINVRTAEICILTMGSITVTHDDKTDVFRQGEAFVMFAGANPTLAAPVNAELFRASVPYESAE